MSPLVGNVNGHILKLISNYIYTPGLITFPVKIGSLKPGYSNFLTYN